MRPNFFVNTPDILHESLQYGGPPMFKIRAVLAAMMSPTWGVYSGFELFEHVAVKPGSEEYLDSEKYQLRPRDWAAAEASGRSLAPYLRRLNEIRRAHPALQQLRTLHFHPVDNPNLICFSKTDPGSSDAVIVVINLSSHNTQIGTTSLRPAGPRPGLARAVRRHRRDHRRELRLGPVQLPRARPLPGARPRLRGHPAAAGAVPAARRLRKDPRAPQRSQARAGPRTRVTSSTRYDDRGLSPPMSVPVPDSPSHRSALPQPGTDPEWFKRAVFYEVLVRGFADSNADGVGDLRGMIDKLDYLQWLGVDCLWLPPFFASPLRDGGYDVSDYTAVLPEFGDIDDFREFLEAAHSRGMRVIIDFVMNHTSDQHPWFQASRSDPEGEYGDFYVWADDDSGYADARIIFVDTESSNWTFDPVRRQYFWHRFFSHQPDLNFENPRVQEAIIDALRFWLDLGVDGFRLDAVPYLFEEEGTNCENLPKTHEFLKHVRKVVDADYPDVVLLCEANQWPADVVEYFGENGDECQMAFHFPVMPRLFMAVRREQRFPISEIMAQTPDIPDNCQWGVFLRNHDELTLEMVTDEERDYMWGEYAKDPRMKANIGIRRRLAPLLDNDTNTLELFNALLLSLPGSPVLYYGDEIGMGDNIWLGDRDGVRTPMQWTPDRNGGFSTADPQRMYLPLNQDPVYGYQVSNVESQLRNSNSLLQWLRRMIQVRNEHPTFGLGTFEEVGSRNPTVLSFVRRFGDDVVLCVNNLSRFPQPVELDLRQFEGYKPVELTGRVEFPDIGVLPYMLTLAGHGFYWFELAKPAAATTDEHQDWESATSSSVADSLLAAGVVSAAEETPGDNAPADGATEGDSR